MSRPRSHTLQVLVNPFQAVPHDQAHDSTTHKQQLRINLRYPKLDESDPFLSLDQLRLRQLGLNNPSQTFSLGTLASASPPPRRAHYEPIAQASCGRSRGRSLTIAHPHTYSGLQAPSGKDAAPSLIIPQEYSPMLPELPTQSTTTSSRPTQTLRNKLALTIVPPRHMQCDETSPAPSGASFLTVSTPLTSPTNMSPRPSHSTPATSMASLEYPSAVCLPIARQSCPPPTRFGDELAIHQRARATTVTGAPEDTVTPDPALEVVDGKKKKKRESTPFDEDGPLGATRVFMASMIDVLDTDGNAVRFGRIFEDRLTIVCFIRHFWCPLCQVYMQSIMDRTSKKVLDRAGMKLVVIGNGSPAMAKAYKEKVFQFPFDIYVDPSRELYRTLGMTRRSMDAGPDELKGDYVVHGPVGGIGMIIKNALKMPIGRAGDMKQLGGEFLFGPGIRSDYAHRMSTTRGHASIDKLLDLANIQMSKMPAGVPCTDSFLDMDEDEWRDEWDEWKRWESYVKTIDEREDDDAEGCTAEGCVLPHR